MNTRAIATCLVALLLAMPSMARADSSFRVGEAKLNGDKLTVDLHVNQSGKEATIDFYAHGQLPKHRNVAVAGPAMKSGLKLGSYRIAPGAHTQTVTVDLKTLEQKTGVVPGATLHIGANWPGLGQNGGHEWGVNAGASHPAYCNGTCLTVPARATQNSRLGWRGRPTVGRRPAWWRVSRRVPGGIVGRGMPGARR